MTQQTSPAGHVQTACLRYSYSWCECVPAVFGEDGFGQQVFVHKHHTGVIPHCEAAILDSTQDVSRVVPGHSVNHRP